LAAPFQDLSLLENRQTLKDSFSTDYSHIATTARNG
jgi:hypothetical protein